MQTLTAPTAPRAPAWAHPVEDPDDAGDSFAEGPTIQWGNVAGTLAWQPGTGPTIMLQLTEDERSHRPRQYLGDMDVAAARAAQHILDELTRIATSK